MQPGFPLSQFKVDLLSKSPTEKVEKQSAADDQHLQQRWTVKKFDMTSDN